VLIAKILAFTVLVPGTVLGWGPWLMIRSRPQSAVDWSTPGAWVGLVVLLLGVLVYGLCALEFGLRGRGTPAPFDPPRELVVTGLYRVVRNPMYFSVVAALLGEGIFYESMQVAAYAACVALVFHVWIVVYEEPKLRCLFGASFATYCASVPRWAPRPGRAHRIH